MIDLKTLTEEPDYRAGAARKGFPATEIDRLVSLNTKYRATLSETESLRADSNLMSKAIGKAAPEEREAKIAEAGEFKARLQSSEESLTTLKSEMESLALTVPNPAHESVPDGGEDDFRVELEHGEQTAMPKFNHAELGEHLGIVNTEKAVAMSGSRFAYVLGDAVRLQFALVQWVMDRLSKHDFVPAVVPVLVREDMMVDAGFFPGDEDTVYRLEKDDLYLVGTSEVGLAGLHRGERLDAEKLPLRYVGYSSCFRREAGTYGKDTSGLFRVHQFDKVEMFVYSHPDRSWDELELLRQLEEENFQALELPYRVVTIAAGDLGGAAAKKYDVEVWIPSEGRYRELTSCSNYTDFSARRMGTRMKTDSGNAPIHTLNGTACAIGRTLLAIFENHQNADGTLNVPKVLRPYCGGIEVIEPR